jgi:hypothetical protein
VLCDRCGGIVKPLVAIDIDGTLGNYHGHFIKFCAMYMQTEFPEDYDGSVEFSDYLGLDKETYRAIKLAYRQGGMKRCMPLHAGARDLITCLNKYSEHADVWVTTTRPHLRLDGIDPDTRFWLECVGLSYHALLYHEDKYRLLADRVDPKRVVLVLDDLREQCEAAESHFGDVAVQLATKYNSGDQYKEWCLMMDAPELLFEAISSWREREVHV